VMIAKDMKVRQMRNSRSVLFLNEKAALEGAALVRRSVCF
jgi:hypothetical protein